MINILIADDNLNFIKVLFNHIQMKLDSNIKISCICTDGEETLNCIYKFKPDIIILDLNLSQKNGVDVLNKLKEITLLKNFYIIIISSEITLLNELRFQNLPIYAILSKPFPFEKILNILEELTLILNTNIFDLLSRFNFNTNSIGFKYLTDAIYISDKTILVF